MQLWTDYEGVTIDGVFSLQKLLSPEGRSAIFSTAGSKGEPTVVRLIECHFDEEEILARWRSVEALRHPNFLKIERYGQTELDERPVVYAVFEKVDANLAGVLDEGHLSVKEVAQLASSLVAALDVLHTHGFVHEHIEPRNIFAVGEGVKLRGDCIREAPEGEQGRLAKQRDVRDLATVLLQALTQRRSMEGISDFAVPPPFNQIIRNGLDGTWELEAIKATLRDKLGSQLAGAPRSVPTAPKPANGATANPAVAETRAASATVEPSRRPEAERQIPLFSQDQDAGFAPAIDGRDALGEGQSFSLRSRWMGAAGVFVLLLLVCTWVVAHAWNVHLQNAARAAAVSPQIVPAGKKISTGPGSVAPGSPSVRASAATGSRANWRVIPYTYDRRSDAEKKAASLARSHPELQPVVFTPSGRAPYLISIGGLMDRSAATALARRALSLGLPHDTYAQNYSR